jgi:hypothetical protein
MDHIGIDVHKRESQLCIRSEGGELVEARIRTTPERFADVLGNRPRARILLEASTESEWVARCLEGLGHEVIVADPNFAPMYAARSRKIKTPFLFGSYVTHASQDRRRGSNGVSSALVRGLRTDESLDRLPLVRRAQVRVPLCHHQRLVAKNLLDRVQVDAGHDQATRRGVPQVVKAEIGNDERE